MNALNQAAPQQVQMPHDRTSGQITGQITELTAFASVFAVSAVAFWWSATALHDVAMAAGMSSTVAWGAPVLVDGPIVMAAFCLVTLRRRRRLNIEVPKHLLGFLWCLLAAAELLSLLGNCYHAWTTEGLRVPQLVAAVAAGTAPVMSIAMIHALTELLDVPRPSRAALAAGTQVPGVSSEVGNHSRGVATAWKPTVPEVSSSAGEVSTLEPEVSNGFSAIERPGQGVETGTVDGAAGDHGAGAAGTQVPGVSSEVGNHSRGVATAWKPTVPEVSSSAGEVSTPEPEVSTVASGSVPVLDEATRNARIVELRQQGRSFREIGEEFGLSHTAVWKIVHRSDDGSEADEDGDGEEGPRLSLVLS